MGDDPEIAELLAAVTAGRNAAVRAITKNEISGGNPYDAFEEAALHRAWQEAFDEAMDTGSEMIHFGV